MPRPLPTQHDVADAELLVDEVLAHPVVDALVPAAQQTEAIESNELCGHLLVESPAARTEEEQRPGGLCSLDGGEDRFGLHHHSGSATEGRIVDRSMDIAGVLA